MYQLLGKLSVNAANKLRKKMDDLEAEMYGLAAQLVHDYIQNGESVLLFLPGMHEVQQTEAAIRAVINVDLCKIVVLHSR